MESSCSRVLAISTDRSVYALAYGWVGKRETDPVSDPFDSRRIFLGMDGSTDLHAWSRDGFVGTVHVESYSSVDDDPDRFIRIVVRVQSKMA